MAEISLNHPIQYVKGVGPKLAKLFNKKGIHTLEDALYFLPRAYEDRTHTIPINRLQPNAPASVSGKVLKKSRIRKGRQTRLQVTLSDGNGELILMWFKIFPGLESEFRVGREVTVYGEVRYYGSRPQIVHPDFEFSDRESDHSSFGRVVPIYSETEGLYQKTIRRVMGEVLKASLDEVIEPLPDRLLQKLSLPKLRDSFEALHTPEEIPPENNLSPATKRIIFEEFFVLQLGLGLKKRSRHSEPAAPLADATGMKKRFIEILPFALTQDQVNAIRDIQMDLARAFPMSRLIQGDVGSGKTVVAFAGAVITASAGFQTALMAPTEILAQQHFESANKWLAPLGIQCVLISHSNSKKPETTAAIANGTADLVIGTHAVFQKSVEFKKLGLVIVDEQHRFGVEQRAALVKKGQTISPHLLLMTATPIPRTLSLTLHGDLDLTLVKQKPKGRIPVNTKIVPPSGRKALYQHIRKNIQNGRQAFIIYPLVEASEKLELKSATDMYTHLQNTVFPDLKIALLHGRLKGPEKDAILKHFKDKRFDILVSTTVIEVGIDIPNATLMVIEHPERLGLSQLHQLRGRVGRGKFPGECLLMVDKFITQRLRIMERTEDGFLLAEEDLKIRGPGEFLGTRQSGLPGFRVGNILRDAELLSLAQQEANRILSQDPLLSEPSHRHIKILVEHQWKERLNRLATG